MGLRQASSEHGQTKQANIDHMTSTQRPTASQLIEHLELKPLPVEGGLFRQSWRSSTRVEVHGQTHPAGTAIYALLTDAPDSFSAMHRLRADEVWHFYLGDAIGMLLLHPDGRVERVVLGADLLGGQVLQMVVPAGCWMGARLLAGGRYGLFGCTSAPGFIETDYEGGDARLANQYPQAAGEIAALLREGAPLSMPTALD